MPLEIPCPQCGAILQAPDGSAGRKARCKKCRHGFRLPGEAPANAAIEESQQLSVVETPAFEFDAPSEPSYSNASKAKYRSSLSGSPPRGASKNKTVLFIVLGVILAGGIAAVAYIATSPDKPPDAASSAITSSKALAEKPAEPVHEPTKNPEPKPDTPKRTEKKAKPIPVLSGGLKLPAPPAKADKLQKFSNGVSIETPFHEIRRVFVSGGESPLAAVIWPSDKGFGGQNAKDTLDRYNLDSGARIDRTEIDAGDGAWPRACDLSPNADRFVSEGPAGTLSLYNLNEKAKIGTPFKPFAEGKPPPALAAVFYLDEDRVLVAAKDGRLETWKDGKCTASGNVGGAITERGLVLKPGRKTLLAMTGASLVSVPTGSLIASPGVALPASPLECYALAAGSGERIAVLYKASFPGRHTLLVVTRPDDSKLISVPLDQGYGIPEQVDWNGAETFTFTTSVAAVAFEMESQRPMAALYPSGKMQQFLAHGRHCVLMPDKADDKKCQLITVSFPPDDYLPLINEARAAKAPVAFLLTSEGFGR